jgi:hypothetical protein
MDNELKEENIFTTAELMTGTGTYKNINYLLPAGSILTVIISYKYNNNIQQKSKKFFTIRFFVESAPSNCNLCTIYLILVRLILDNYISSIFSRQCKFLSMKFNTNFDQAKTTKFPLGGIYGKLDSSPHYYPLKFKLYRVLSDKEQQLVLYGIPNEYGSWDSYDNENKTITQGLENFNKAFTEIVELNDVKLRCIGVNNKNSLNSQTSSEYVSSIFPEGFVYKK